MANQGRGWHGDSSGHAKAGQKGGQARSNNQMNQDSGNPGQFQENDERTEKAARDGGRSSNR